MLAITGKSIISSPIAHMRKVIRVMFGQYALRKSLCEKDKAAVEFCGHLAACVASKKGESIVLSIALENFVILLYFGCHMKEGRIDSGDIL